MTPIYQHDTVQLNPERITSYVHPVFGDTTVFHNVVIASEMVQPYEDGKAWKPREELEIYAPYVDGRWVIVGEHPAEGIISSKDQVSGRTVNPRYVKDLLDPKTKRPCRAGVRADIEIFNDKVPPATLEDMKNGKKQDVSIGFFYTKDEKPGVVETDVCKGEEYDYIQRNMFHDHLAAGLENGRCPMPYCGLGADELTRNIMGDPFAGFENFAACLAHMTKPKSEGGQGYTEEQARKVCGMLQAKHEKKKKDDDELRQASRIVWQAILDELEALKGEREATEKADKAEWWREIDWAEDASRTVFDALPEETRSLIVEAGLCPECMDAARSEAERAMSHFNISPEDWEKLSDEEKEEYIKKLPPRGSGGEDEVIEDASATDEYELEYVEADKQMTYAQKAALPDSDYAYIEPGCKKEDGKTQQSCRHMPIHDPAHVRAALAALSGARTGKVPPYASKAKPKVCAAAKKFKIESDVCGAEKKKKKDELDPYEVMRRADKVLNPFKP
jgi:hypothetical protein